MARVEVVMPQMGESITNGTITKWHKVVGDKVELDEIILEISTDKVESEIPSPYEGRMEEILYPEGETIDVGLPIAIIEDDPDSVAFNKGEKSKDVQSQTESKSQEEVKAAPAKTIVENQGTKRRFYTPLVKALAKEHGVDLSELVNIKGSGAAGRVNKADFMAYIEQRKSEVVTTSNVSTPALVSTSGRVEIIPMNNMRKVIAKNMVASKLTSPHVNSIDTVDMTNLVKFRESFKHDFKKQEGITLTYTHFILYALIDALKKFPMVNASIDGDNIIVKKDINIGCAVAVPGNGLVVPVIKGADNLNITGIARALNDLVIKARNKKLTMDDLTGGTYTFTNNGSFGILLATPVILQPQLGIFCVGTIKKMPVVTADDAIAIRQIMYSTHTYDHRLIDGELGSKFLKFVHNTLETMDPSKLF